MVFSVKSKSGISTFCVKFQRAQADETQRAQRNGGERKSERKIDLSSSAPSRALSSKT